MKKCLYLDLCADAVSGGLGEDKTSKDCQQIKKIITVCTVSVGIFKRNVCFIYYRGSFSVNTPLLTPP